MPSRLHIVFALGVIALLMFACGPITQVAALTPIPTLAPGATPTLVSALQIAGANVGTPSTAGPIDAAAGASLFGRYCTPCHGAQGQGVNGPALRNSSFIQGTDLQVIAQVVGGGRIPQGMPAWQQASGGPLNTAQIANIVAYLKTMQNVPAVARATVAPTETPVPNPPTPAPAVPSNPGDAGEAVNLTGDPNRGRGLFGTYCSFCHGPEGLVGIPNPGSNDGFVPALNPIDETIANSDKKSFVKNLDLFIEHGSVPSGDAPRIAMPAFGEQKLLTPQQIADLIAFLISLKSSP